MTLTMLAPRIAFACAFAPIFCVHTTWLIASLMDNLHWCLPYWHSCHSISATGRQYPEFFVFKAIMIPVAALMLAYWSLLWLWLGQISVKRTLRKGVLALGYCACVALVLYTVTLGATGEPYKLARRIGIVLFFVCTSFAHLLLLNGLSKHMDNLSDVLAVAIGQWLPLMTKVCVALVLGSAINGLLGFFWDYWDAWENAFEWTYSLIMMSLFFIVGQMWKSTGFRISIALDGVKTPRRLG